MPQARSSTLLVRTRDTSGFQSRLVMGKRDQEAGEQTALVARQVEPSPMDSLDPDMPGLGQVEEFFELGWLAQQPVQMPGDDHDAILVA